MAEYWKSTPKYWCKHCSTYVKDTKFERTQHEATAKHQGSLKRFLRGVHQEHEKEEREKQRAKAEVDRLRGLVGGSSASSVKVSTSTAPKAQVPTAPPHASIAERKKQMAQLVEMGISVPEEFRGDLALAGEWQTVSQRAVDQKQDAPPEARSVGVRKRKIEDEEDGGDTTSIQPTARRVWGSTTKTYPGDISVSHPALDDLLNRNTLPKKELSSEVKSKLSDHHLNKATTRSAPDDIGEDREEDDKSAVKREIDELAAIPAADSPQSKEGPQLKQDIQQEIVFKKRKPKVAKHG